MQCYTNTSSEQLVFFSLGADLCSSASDTVNICINKALSQLKALILVHVPVL